MLHSGSRTRVTRRFSRTATHTKSIIKPIEVRPKVKPSPVQPPTNNLPTINMVFGAKWDWVFEKILRKYQDHFAGQYNIMPSVMPLRGADVYQYWRPACLAMQKLFERVPVNHPLYTKGIHMLHDSPYDIKRHNTEYRKSHIGLFNHVMCTSQEQIDFYTDYTSHNKLVYTPLGPLNDNIFQEKTTPNLKDRIRIGFVARAYKDGVKGTSEIIKIASELDPKKFEFVMHTNDVKLKRCLGIKFDVNRSNDIDVLLICSKYEGTPLPLLEALASGTYVLSTSVGIAPEVLQRNQICRSVNDFVSTLKYIESNRSMLKRFTAVGPKLVADRTWDRFFEGSEKMWRDILGIKHAVHKKKYDHIRLGIFAGHPFIPRFMQPSFDQLPFKHKFFITNNSVPVGARHYDKELMAKDTSFLEQQPLAIIRRIKELALTHLMVWNGEYNDRIRGNLFPIIKQIKAETNVKIIYAEHAWLPQNDYITIDDMGVCGNSSLTHITDIPIIRSQRRVLERTVAQYRRKVTDVEYKDFIYVPLQIKTDTQIVNHSKHFKEMGDFITHLAWMFKDECLVVKGHPKDSKTNLLEYQRLCSKYRNIHYVNDMNNISYCFHAKAMVCINSTTVNEGLLFGKPIMTFGKNVFSNKGITYEIDDVSDMDYQLKFLDFIPDTRLINNYLMFLLSKQICALRPDIKKVIRYFEHA